jgi:anion-transporting  ArsA/GET3 family ATPase
MYFKNYKSGKLYLFNFYNNKREDLLEELKKVNKELFEVQAFLKSYEDVESSIKNDKEVFNELQKKMYLEQLENLQSHNDFVNFEKTIKELLTLK